MPTEPTVAWYNKQVDEYKSRRQFYSILCRRLGQFLERAAKGIMPHALIQTRIKAVDSFAEKLLRHKYPEPFKQMTDLCGVRVITHTEAEVRAWCAFIEQH